MKEFQRTIYIDDDYIAISGEREEVAIKVDQQLAERSIELCGAVLTFRAQDITEFDYTPEWGQLEVNGDKLVIDLSKLHVSATEFWWSGYIKRTCIGITTGRINIAEL